MKEPTTTLDSRFSDPNAVATDWKETRHILESAQLFWICTVRADGRPHLTPLVAVWLDGAVHFCTGATEQKAINLRSNPHVILLTGCNQWDKGIDVVVEGDAVQVTDNEALERLARAWTTNGMDNGNTRCAMALFIIEKASRHSSLWSGQPRCLHLARVSSVRHAISSETDCRSLNTVIQNI